MDSDRHRLPEGRSVSGQDLPVNDSAALRGNDTELSQPAVPLQTDRFVGQAEVGPAPAAPDALPARNAARRRHKIASAEASDIPPHADDSAGELVSGNQCAGGSPGRVRGHRKLDRAVSIFVAIGAADARGRHFHEQLTVGRLWLRYLFDPQVTSAAVDGCSHGQLMRSALATTKIVQSY